MRQTFETATGMVELSYDEDTRIVSAHRFGVNGRPVAAAMEDWDHVNFASVLMRQLGLAREEAEQIASVARAAAGRPGRARPGRPPGLAVRLAAVLLRTVTFLLPLAIFLAVFFAVRR